MTRTSRFAWSAVLVYFPFAFPPVAPAQAGDARPAAPAQDSKAQKRKQKEEKDRQRREAARKDEERFAYKGWLEEVSVIITEEELDAFKKLSANEERESAIEILHPPIRGVPRAVRNLEAASRSLAGADNPKMEGPSRILELKIWSLAPPKG